MRLMEGIGSFQHGDSKLFCYYGIRCGQTHKVYEEFSKEFLSQFDRIIEIGTHRGGFSHYLSHMCDATVYSYDIKSHLNSFKDLDKSSLHLKKKSNLNFIVSDVFKASTANEIISLIKDTGRTLLLCDGGDKIKEFKFFSEFLKPNDVVMIHDYEHDEKQKEELSERIDWYFMSESFRSSIDNCVQKNNLIEFNYHSFCDVLWGSFIKGCENG